MTDSDHNPDTPADDARHALARWLRRHRSLIVICLLFAVVRFPVAWRQVPAQDEEYFVVPGLAILRDGVPRIPYMPSRNRESAFYKADELLFTLPPLYFYCEAVVYQIIGASTGAARLVSMFCAIAAIVVVHRLARSWFNDDSAALWAAGLYAASRAIYFPAITARPDMLCGLLGLATLLAITRWTTSRSRVALIVAGALIGATGLTHPFAIVPAMQATIWMLIASRGGRERLRNLLILAASATAVFTFWAPLIALNPQAFRTQFTNAVLNQTGPGLFSRLILPFHSFASQWPIFLEHVGVPQASLMLVGTSAATWMAVRHKDRGLLCATLLALSGIYLHVATVGGHPTKGYWCYTGALLFIATAGALSRLLSPQPTPNPRLRFRTCAAIAVAAAFMLPGAGLRTVAVHLRNWNDINYDAPRFTQQLMTAVPADARLVVDPKYIFDFYRDGRNVKLAMDFDFFYSVRGVEYDFLIAGPYSLRDGIPEVLAARFEKAYGNRDDLFSCYAERYRAPSSEPRK